MSKRVILYRHGKSDWDADYQEDHDRPLSARGIRSATIMGRLLAESIQAPDLILTSSALRAKQTLEISLQQGKWNCRVKEKPALYYDDLPAIVKIIQKLSDSYSSVMLVGHEPKWSILTSRLIGGGDITFPTAAMARIDFDCDSWKNVAYGQGTLKWLHQPSFFLKKSHH